MSQPLATPQAPEPSTAQGPPRSFTVTWLLALFLGSVGADRFYLGKTGTAIAKLVTLGALGIWSLVDLIIVLTGRTTDRSGRRLTGYDAMKVTAFIVTGAFVLGGGIGGTIIAVGTYAVLVSPTPAVGQPAPDASVGDTPATDAPTPTPTEAVASTPAATAAWAEEKFGTFEEITLSGAGDAVIPLPEGSDAGLVHATHSGAGTFGVQVINEDGMSTINFALVGIGEYSGTAAYGLNRGTWLKPGVALQVSTDGPWEVTMAPISDAPEFEQTGTSDQAFLYSGAAAELAVSSQTPDGHFSVQQFTDDRLGAFELVNEFGAYEGTAPIHAGPSVVLIGADEAWTATLE
jgi:hypothetical protein